MQQQQQQPGSYDLLAVFSDEPKAEAAAVKLRKEGFSNEEVFQLPSGVAEKGQFREHGPNIARRETFLQVQRSGPNPVLVVVLAIVFGLVLGLVAFAASFPFKLPEPTTLIIGAVIGIIIVVIIGLLRRGRTGHVAGQSAAEQGTKGRAHRRCATPERCREYQQDVTRPRHAHQRRRQDR